MKTILTSLIFIIQTISMYGQEKVFFNIDTLTYSVDQPIIYYSIENNYDSVVEYTIDFLSWDDSIYKPLPEFSLAKPNLLKKGYSDIAMFERIKGHETVVGSFILYKPMLKKRRLNLKIYFKDLLYDLNEENYYTIYFPPPLINTNQ